MQDFKSQQYVQVTALKTKVCILSMPCDESRLVKPKQSEKSQEEFMLP